MTRHLPTLLLCACAYEAPLDPAASPALNGITGAVIFSGPGAPATTFLFLYDASDPGPPAGTGSPLTFTTVPAAAFTGRGQGMEAADFAFTQVPDGSYYINALMDHDGDFNPFGDGVAGATCGDATGSHTGDWIALAPAPVTVRGGQLVDDVPVLLGGPLLTERPAFALPEAFTVSRAKLAASVDAAGQPVVENLQLLPLQAVGVHARYSADLLLDLPGPCEPALDCADLPSCPCAADASCETAIPVWLVDDDEDGVVDPYPADLQASLGLLNVWPRVYLEYLGHPTTVDGVPTFSDPLGTFRYQGEQLPERWVSEAFPLAAELQGAAIQGIPFELVAGGPVGVPFGAQRLDVTLSPVFRHYHGEGTAGVDANGPYDVVNLVDPSVPAEAVPAGAWSVTLIGPGGQTWTVPNEIGLLGLDDAGPDAPQARALIFE